MNAADLDAMSPLLRDLFSSSLDSTQTMIQALPVGNGADLGCLEWSAEGLQWGIVVIDTYVWPQTL
jgi:hypothetical protein